MDYGILALVVLVAIVGGAMAFAKPRRVVPLDELLARLVSIQDDPQLTAAQKRHKAELEYRNFERYTVSMIGVVHDVYPNAALVMKTSLRDLPLVGVELSRVSPEQMLAFNKGKAITLRVRLPAWERYADVVGLAGTFRDGKVFYGGRWYDVKSTYRVRDPAGPQTGNFKAVRPDDHKRTQ